MPIRIAIAVSLLVIVGLQGAASASAEEVTEEVLSPSGIVRAMSTFLAAADSIAVHIEVNFDDVLRDGTKVQYAGAGDITLRRPDGLYVDYADDVSAKEIWYDGQNFTIYDSLHNIYAVIPTAPRLNESIHQLENEYGVVLPIGTLLRDDPAARIQELTIRQRYLGIHDVDGIASHHFLFQGEHGDWQIWIDAGDRPLPRKLVVTHREEPSSPQNVILLTDWEFGLFADVDLFQPDLPSNAIQAEPLKLSRQGQ